jgi:hypothetical protein
MNKVLNFNNLLDVESLEKELLTHDQADCPVIHRFGPGTYIREVKLPAGILAIGHHQNFEHMNVFLKGRVTIMNDNGSTSELVAPMIFVGKPGRKVGIIHEDVVWLNVYENSTNEQDIEKLESKLLTKSDNFKLSEESRNKIMLEYKSEDHKDFELALSEIGVSKEFVKEQSENKSDMIELPFGGYKTKVSPSNIDGLGVFAAADIEAGEVIGPARISGKRTVYGRYVNHSKKPNAVFISGIHGDIYLIATKKISGCHGGFNGDEVTVDYREAYNLNIKISRGLKCQQ